MCSLLHYSQMVDEKIVLITGSSGFIGSALAKRLSSKYRVVSLDKNEPAEKIPNVVHFSLDISSKENVRSALTKVRDEYGTQIASVIHLAAYYSFSGKESPKYQEITVEGSRTLLAELNDLFQNVEQFIFSSTMLVHAPTERGIEITESSPVAPTWPYPQSKVDAEEAIQAKREDTPVVNLRIAGVYDDYCHSLPIAQHIARIYERQLSSMLFPGNAEHGQAFLHLDDLVEAVSILIDKRAELPPHTTLLLGEDETLSYNTLQTKLGGLLHQRPWPTIRVPRFIAKTGAFFLGHLPVVREPFIKPWMIDYADDHYDLDISRAEKLLDWKPKRNLLEALPKMVAALKTNPEKWYKDHKIKKPPHREFFPPTPYQENAYRAAALINAFGGIWLLSNAFTLGYAKPIEFWSDLLTGTLITAIAALTLAPTLRWLRWANCGLAVWLMFSPLVFWTESAAVYSNNTLLAGLILLASAYTPSKSPETRQDDEAPEGWTYNPSAWSQRIPIMTLAFIGFLLARYLAAFQLGHIPRVWDPFFASGSETILKSDISKAFPVSDAGLGALSYLLDVISAAIGGRNRWRTMPWMVILFGLFIIPTGVTSITLVMLQPIAVGAWCTICLFTAVIMLAMVPPATDEVLASIQFLRRSVRAGMPFWQTLWFGTEERQPKAIITKEGKKTFPAHLLVSALLGVWLMFAPWILGIEGAAANNIYIVAALVATFAIIAFSEIARVVRMVNVLLGFWLGISAWFLGSMSTPASLHSALIGLAVVVLSLPRGKIIEHFGTLDSWTRWSPRQPLRRIHQRR